MGKRPCKQILKSQDAYGYPIGVTFNKEGNIHRTPIGGFITLISKMFLLLFLGIGIKKVLNYEGDTYTSWISTFDPSELGQVSYMDTRLHMMVSLYDLSKGMDVNIPYDEEF